MATQEIIPWWKGCRMKLIKRILSNPFIDLFNSIDHSMMKGCYSYHGIIVNACEMGRMEKRLQSHSLTAYDIKIKQMPPQQFSSLSALIHLYSQQLTILIPKHLAHFLIKPKNFPTQDNTPLLATCSIHRSLRARFYPL